MMSNLHPIKGFCRYFLLISLMLGVGFASAAQEETPALTKAVYLVKEGDYALAADFCSQVITNNPELAQAYYIRGYAYYKAEKLKESIEDFNTTIELNPGYANAYYYRGICKRKTGKLWSSFRDLSKANELNPGSTQSSLLLGLVKSIF
jgi:tetratricopeptide (TPR) repeat protein